MSSRHKVSCVLCSLSDETNVTGALSTKNKVTAHQNCLLFSSGLLSENSPEFDDLFGFSVEDVQKEVTRGKQLVCPKCKKKGATAGCEVKRCKKSYHYPCAVKDGAEPIEDLNSGKYVLYCQQHKHRCSTEERPVHSPNQQTDGPSTPQPSSPSPDHCERGRAGISTDSPEASCGFSSPVNHLADPKINSVSFWQGCTAAGCTQGIFADFINEMNNVSSRIQSNTASQEDCDLALAVIKSSGKLFELVTKQQNELLKKQSDLIKAVASMEEVISTLRR